MTEFQGTATGSTDPATTGREVDVLIVGAGISGIDAAYRVQEECPDLTYAVVEARSAIGGTWDLFRYPGIRSDSDFFTLAFPFLPWRGRNSIVDGEEIRGYLDDAVRRYGIDEHIRFDTRVTSANWSSEQARWHVTVSSGGTESTMTARFLMTCAGYYDYENPYDAQLTGLADFGGTVVHPQSWPADLDHAGKKVLVIGSGATAITLVPALAKAGAEVTQLQRTPSYVLAQPRVDPIATLARRVLPPAAAHRVLRAKNTGLQWGMYQACRRAPKLMRAVLRRGAIFGTGSAAIADEHFNPPYEPWDQRLCVSPGGDLFKAVRSGAASIVTGRIDTFVANGVRLADGTVLEADVVVTATGLTLQLLGGMAVTVDGAAVDVADSYVYCGAMLSGVPNFSFCIGYINLSWTVRADMTARLVTRVLRRLVDTGMDQVVPVRPGGGRRRRTAAGHRGRLHRQGQAPDAQDDGALPVGDGAERLPRRARHRPGRPRRGPGVAQRAAAGERLAVPSRGAGGPG